MFTHPRRAWRFIDYVQLTSLLLVTAWLHREPILDIINIGRHDPEQSHVFLAPLVAAYLLWLRRSRLRYIPVHPSLIGPLVAGLGWLVSWWGFEQGVQYAWHGGAAISIAGVIFTMTGMTPLFLLGPVFAVMAFALPVPGEIRHAIAYPLQTLATSVTHFILELIGITNVKSGNILIINGERVAVGEACNGMRMVFALALVVYAFAFGTALRPGTRLTLLLLSPFIAMACNVLRLVPTSLIFGYGGNETAQQFHDLAGWIMLPVAMIMLAFILRAIRWLEFPVTRLRLASQ